MSQNELEEVVVHTTAIPQSNVLQQQPQQQQPRWGSSGSYNHLMAQSVNHIDWEVGVSEAHEP